MSARAWFSAGVAGLCVAITAAGVLAQCDEEGWLPADRPAGAGVNSDYPWVGAEWDPDGEGPLPSRLVISGPFYSAGGRLANSIAAWDGTAWLPLGDGLRDFEFTAYAQCLHVHNGELYAGGHFLYSESAFLYNIARWDGGSWQPLGDGTDDNVVAMTTFNGDLIAAGEFTSAGGVFASRIARWDGMQWHPMGVGFEDGWVSALAVYNGELYAAGGFTASGATTLDGIAKWNGAAWVSVGGGLHGDSGVGVTAMAVSGGSLIVAGLFDHAGLVSAQNVARWDGSAWHAMGAGIDLAVASLAEAGSDLVAVSQWHRVLPDAQTLDPDSRKAFRWDGSSWTALPVVQGSPTCVTPYMGEPVIIGQLFADSDGDRAGGVLRWDGASWQTIGEQGLAHRDVAAMVPYQGDVAIALRQDRLHRTTFFDFGLEMPIVRRSGGQVTETLGTVDMQAGVPYVQKLLPDGDNLYVCGSFDQVDGLPVQNIAKWDGSSWSDLGGGIGPVGIGVESMAIFNGELIAGGAFLEVEGSPGNSIVRWDGVAWQPLGSGLQWITPDFTGAGSASELLVYNGQLLAVGGFTTAGGVAADNLAIWNGTSWAAFPGGGTDSLITGACLHNGDLVISGPFTIVGGVPANGIARWDGTAWHAMGFGLGGANGDFGYARRFATAGSDLYVAGYFTFADGLPANNIAKWDGSAWSTLGDGIERVIYDFGPGAEVLALHIDGNELLVGGVFNMAGGEGAANFARYCLGGAACPADRDGNGDVDVFDLLAYLDDWFAGSAAAELTGDDPASIDVFDLLTYLDGWFAGC